MYSSEYYQKNKNSIRKAQQKYYSKNKTKLNAANKHLRIKWDAEHRAYLNEHARLNNQIKKLENEPYSTEVAKFLEILHTNKSYLKELHSKGLI